MHVERLIAEVFKKSNPYETRPTLIMTIKHIGGRLKPLFLGYPNWLTTSDSTCSAILCIPLSHFPTWHSSHMRVFRHVPASTSYFVFLLVVSYLKKVKAVAPSWIRNESNKKEIINLAFDDNVILIAV